MSATRDTLRPADNAELLQVTAWARRFSRRENEQAWAEAKRDLVLCMERQTLLVALADGTPAARSGPEGHVLLAFTDDEAAQAWAADQRPEAPACGFGLSSETAPKSERDGRKLWLSWFDERSAVAVVVNPAGPNGFVVHDYECRTMRPRLRRRRIDQTQEAWLDLDARAQERVRAADLLNRSADAIARRDEAAFEQLAPELKARNRLFSMHAAAEHTLHSGRRHLIQGDSRLGIFQLLYGALYWGRFGDPWRSIDALLESGEILLGMREQHAGDADELNWLDTPLTHVADALREMSIGYREDEFGQFSQWRTPRTG